MQTLLQILVADDDPVNLLVTKGLLKAIGYPCDTVPDGLAVISQLKKKSYDIVFMDIQMPGLDGCETTSQIRALFGGRPYVIAMSARDESEIRTIVKEYDMNDYIAKPVTKDGFELVLDRFRTSLARNSEQDELPDQS